MIVIIRPSTSSKISAFTLPQHSLFAHYPLLLFQRLTDGREAYPRKYIYGVLDNLYDAVQAVHALRFMDFDPGDIHVMASWDFVEAVERRQQQQHRLAKMLTRLLTLLDEGFGDVYLHEALRGHHILAVRLCRNEQLLQVYDTNSHSNG